MLGRDTKWRQGSVLTDKDAHALHLVESLQSGKRAIVISHDCDLPNEAEEFVEVIVGSVVPKPDLSFICARNPRRLHLGFSSELSELTWIELRHADKHQVDKKTFASIQGQDGNLVLSAEEKPSLKQWLVARYGRPAFPNAFEQRLRREMKGNKVERRIAKVFEQTDRSIIAVFFDLGTERDIELTEDQPYLLSIIVVYDAEQGGMEARKIAETLASSLTTLLHEAYGPANSATEIALERCTAVADTNISLADLRKIDQWRLEYISLREDPTGNFIAAVTLPI